MLHDDLLVPARVDRAGLAPLAWIALLADASLLCVLLDRTEALLLLCAGSLAAVALARPSARQWRVLFIFAATSTAAFIVGQGLFYAQVPRTILATLVPPDVPVLGAWTGGIRLYREGLLHGLVQSLRMTAMLCLGLAACWSVNPQDLLLALTRLRVPHGVAFMTVTAFRFLPVVAREAMTVATVQQLRGYRPSLWRPGNAFAAWAGRLRAIFAGALRRAVTLTMAVQGRGFTPGAPRTCFRVARFTALDFAVAGTATAVTLAVAAAKLLYALHLYDLMHADALRGLYAFVREAL